MAGCERRGGLKPRFLWSILNHFPMPGISSMAELDPGNYFRQDLAGPIFDLWWVLFSIKEARRGDLVRAMSYVMCQNVTCPAPPASFGGTIGKGSRCAPVTQMVVGAPPLQCLSGCSTVCLSFCLLSTHSIYCYLSPSLWNHTKFLSVTFLLWSSCEVPFHAPVIQLFTAFCREDLMEESGSETSYYLKFCFSRIHIPDLLAQFTIIL